jgi:hypothetical protein
MAAPAEPEVSMALALAALAALHLLTVVFVL